ncbi:hypothetical protein M1105_20470 [Limibaculum sp. FT325]|uniref:hypothetical protein n=1 Tax=Thermohalobaculum sediminis TaxID=2939436 RepID=UPI0020C14E17|nr:hypothetical protein [Limibaculum sediminis]MCL5779326.1 hypothetical protein [Limibaculum sediminis]
MKPDTNIAERERVAIDHARNAPQLGGQGKARQQCQKEKNGGVHGQQVARRAARHKEAAWRPTIRHAQSVE